MKRLIKFKLLIVACALTVVAQSDTSKGNRPAHITAPLSSNALVAASEDECGCETQVLPEVLAIVDGVKITRQEIEQSIGKQVNELKHQVIAARTRELTLQVNSKLLSAEAKRLGTNFTALINSEIVATVKEPTEAEAQAFYEQNKTRIRGEFKDLIPKIIDHLRTERQTEAARIYAERLRTDANVSMPASVTPPRTIADRARIFATVKGENITSGDIEDALQAGIFNVQEQIYNLRKQTLELRINDTLLEREALRRKVTTSALLQTEVASKMKTVTAEQARAFYDQHKNELNGEFSKLQDQILNHLQDQEERAAQTTFAHQLRLGVSLQIFLIVPEPPVYQIAIDDQPSRGSENAPVTIIEFTDFQCPSCAGAHPVLEKLVKEYDGKVRWVVRDFPLENHADAFKAAEATEAARQQGKYWEYVALLMNNQSSLSVESLKEYAVRLGMDRQKFDAALEAGTFSDKIQRDLRDGIRYGVDSTPALFINGRRVKDNSYEAIVAAIEVALTAAKP